jgi:hypothetical protein
MTYLNSLLQYRELADRITSGEYEPESRRMAQEASRGLVERPTRVRNDQPQQERRSGPEDAMMGYMLAMRQRGQEPEPEESTTGAMTEAMRPRARPEAGSSEVFNAPVRPLLSNAFRENLELDEGAAETLSKAFLLNFQDESGMIPDRIESEPNVRGTRGKGYYQLTGDRRDRFESLYGPDGYTDENQVEFLVAELTGSESRAGREILAAAQSGNVGETAAVIVSRFLRPAAQHRDERVARYRANF